MLLCMYYSIELHQNVGKEAKKQIIGFDAHMRRRRRATDSLGQNSVPPVQNTRSLGNKYNEINLYDVPEQPRNSHHAPNG